MRQFHLLSWLLMLVAFACARSAAAAPIVTLVDETFTAGSAAGNTWTSAAAGVSSGQQWKWTPLSGETGVTTEVWTGTGGASARGLATTYDHDQNGGTAPVNIPGGFEVMSGYTSNGLPDSLQVAIAFLLPTSLEELTNGTLTFFAANRIISGSGGQLPLVSVRNVTDNRNILAPTAIAYPGPGLWNFNSFVLDYIAADAGDLIELRFSEAITSGGAQGARGLQIADVTLTAAVVPEPTSLAVWSLMGLTFAAFGRYRLAHKR